MTLHALSHRLPVQRFPQTLESLELDPASVESVWRWAPGSRRLIVVCADGRVIRCYDFDKKDF